MSEHNIVVEVVNAKKTYKSGDSTIVALDTANVSFKKGELTLIMGPSGSGKTTLLSLVGCVIYPTEGEVKLHGKVISGYSEDKLADIRLNTIGFVFQAFNLLEPLNALENVMQPLLLQKVPHLEAKKRAKEALLRVDLESRMHNLPKKLSGGQKQRVAIARALVTNPEIILCDEPTASLDAKSAAVIMNELRGLAHQNKAVIIVTHDLRLRKFADRIIYVEEGIVSNTISNEEDYK